MLRLRPRSKADDQSFALEGSTLSRNLALPLR